MFNLHERWTTYGSRDEINGWKSRPVSSHATWEEAVAARDELTKDVAFACGEVDAFISDANGNEVRRDPVAFALFQATYSPITNEDCPF